MIITLQLAYINIHLHTISAVTTGQRFGSICATSVASSRLHNAEVAGVDSERWFYDPLLFREVIGVLRQAEDGGVMCQQHSQTSLAPKIQTTGTTGLDLGCHQQCVSKIILYKTKTISLKFRQSTIVGVKNLPDFKPLLDWKDRSCKKICLKLQLWRTKSS